MGKINKCGLIVESRTFTKNTYQIVFDEKKRWQINKNRHVKIVLIGQKDHENSDSVEIVGCSEQGITCIQIKTKVFVEVYTNFQQKMIL